MKLLTASAEYQQDHRSRLLTALKEPLIWRRPAFSIRAQRIKKTVFLWTESSWFRHSGSKALHVLSYLKNIKEKIPKPPEASRCPGLMPSYGNSETLCDLNPIRTMVYKNSLNAGCWSPLSIINRIKSSSCMQCYRDRNVVLPSWIAKIQHWFCCSRFIQKLGSPHLVFNVSV